MVNSYIISQIFTDSDHENVVDQFRKFDKNNDGLISLSEMKAALSEIENTESGISGHEDIERLLNMLDFDKSGFIDYT